MPDLYSLTTFSGLTVCAALIVLFYRLFTVAAIMLFADGVGGTAIVWDRWSQRTGHQIHFSALMHASPPTGSEVAMLVTHLPLAVLGLMILGIITWRRKHEIGALNDMG